METVSDRILHLLEEKGMSYGELSKLTGIPKSSLQRYAVGKTNKVPIDVVESIAVVLSVSASELMGWNVSSADDKDIITYPVIGDIAAGYGMEAVEEYTGSEIRIPKEWLKGRKKEDFFALRVRGNSMFPSFQEGDIILVRRQSTLNYSGQVGVIIYEDNNATLKKVEYIMGEDWMRLVPINPQFPPTMVEGEALEHCRVLGYPVKLIRDV